MPTKMLLTPSDVRSIWCLRILTIASLIVTIVLALTNSPRLTLAAPVSVLLLLLSAVNRTRIHSRLKTLHGRAVRRRRGGTSGSSAP